MNLSQYLQESREELSRVSWPTRPQVWEGTQAVLLFLVALTLIVYLMDLVFTTLIKGVLL
ncbi:preprotein translocase subunit SecE [Deinococcus radiophilus]|uniref:Protein translocase subunit SecE n=1 Tax=Deinococcus radiophilus TaxID=32062 RepID=A0A431VZG1_9DEIO|nr:preprotein translocase subunit SecE [Deinococcus radiophilus]RTR28650.1 preprotein translocase subunit SecE [Deinococcus radiophilus]UFA51072.1 preprotein translocase subunit SecE [Deinococcus radiophilus]